VLLAKTFYSNGFGYASGIRQAGKLPNLEGGYKVVPSTLRVRVSEMAGYFTTRGVLQSVHSNLQAEMKISGRKKTTYISHEARVATRGDSFPFQYKRIGVGNISGNKTHRRGIRNKPDIPTCLRMGTPLSVGANCRIWRNRLFRFYSYLRRESSKQVASSGRSRSV